MRVVFMGNPSFAIPTLKALLKSHHNVVAVVSNPIKRIGRNNKKSLTPVGNFAVKNNITNINPDSLKSEGFRKKIALTKADIFIVVAYKILPSSLINIPKYGSLNLHASLLPKYRGAGPIQWALMNGDKITGVTIFQIKRKVDTGNILFQKRVTIKRDDNMQTLGMRLCEIGADSMLSVLKNIEDQKVDSSPQNSDGISLAPKITKEMLIINWSWAAKKIHNWIRGLSPYPGMHTFFKNKKVRIFKTKVIEGLGEKGVIVSLDKKSCIIGTGDQLISILEIQLEGKKKMDIRDFLMGSTFKKGNVLG
jgi:methionyl-tRNA formyltransferase